MVSNCVEQEELPRYFSCILLVDAYNLENSSCYLVHKIAVKLVNVPDTRYSKPNKNVTNNVWRQIFMYRKYWQSIVLMSQVCVREGRRCCF